MLTGRFGVRPIASWDASWLGGISKLLEVMEQMTLLLFQRRLDGTQTAPENNVARLGQPIERPIFPEDSMASARAAVGLTATCRGHCSRMRPRPRCST